MLLVSSSKFVCCRKNLSFKGHRFRTVTQPSDQLFGLRGKDTTFFLIRFMLHLRNKACMDISNIIWSWLRMNCIQKNTSVSTWTTKVFLRPESRGVVERVGVVGCCCWANRSIPSQSVWDECNRSRLSGISQRIPAFWFGKWLQLQHQLWCSVNVAFNLDMTYT